ncbi:uncharacterized protein LOC127751701 [Frankliniella occidentalis]|uniref:Uncharacterized protein LOC127751701 n=1 Tax=Frankliniella occidentalis TaxID=133901 RepID=A0A9C6XUQ5_FRAOC|nr:uncharacterized protein LOC127751701 [Frankliniella occidentalis]
MGPAGRLCAAVLVLSAASCLLPCRAAPPGDIPSETEPQLGPDYETSTQEQPSDGDPTEPPPSLGAPLPPTIIAVPTWRSCPDRDEYRDPSGKCRKRFITAKSG